ERKNIEVVKAVLEIMGKPQSLIEFVQDRPGHDIRYSLNCEKIVKNLGWRAHYSFEDGIRRTIDWYMAHQGWLNQKVRYIRSYWSTVYKRSGKGK
ncbi:MAG: GDP-mannose 4,6-dehydratase, partial [Candidatus Omnitrophica bacterium]|nr:GDP-mannose 4,6-dehydratase [Candidatus Omnitrophota bacterium]